MSTRAYIALGSNLGDRKANLDGALAALAATDGISVVAVSNYLETEPVGMPGESRHFLNAAAALDTTLDPLALFQRLLEIETLFGRERSPNGWTARTLDLDVLLYGDNIIETQTLIVPHPRMHERRFVLEPLAEIAPAVVDPRSGSTIQDLLAQA